MASQPTKNQSPSVLPAEQTPILEPGAHRLVPPLFSGRPTSSSPPDPNPGPNGVDGAATGLFGGSDETSEQPSDGRERGSAPSGKALSRKAIRTLIRDGLEGAQAGAHEAFCRDELDRVYGRWLAEQDELDGLADPVSGLVSRRMTAAGVAPSPDTADAIAAGAALLHYVVRQLKLWWAVRSERARMAGGYVPAEDEPAPERA